MVSESEYPTFLPRRLRQGIMDEASDIKDKYGLSDDGDVDLVDSSVENVVEVDCKVTPAVEMVAEVAKPITGDSAADRARQMLDAQVSFFMRSSFLFRTYLPSLNSECAHGYLGLTSICFIYFVS